MNSIKPLVAACAFATYCGVAGAAMEDEVRAALERFVQVQNEHDSKGLEELLLDSPQFLWITRGTAIWGRDAALKRFAQLYQGTWKLEPDWAALRILPAGGDAAHLFVPIQFTAGAPGQAPTVARFYVNQVLLKTGSGWKVSTILPVPAPAP